MANLPPVNLTAFKQTVHFSFLTLCPRQLLVLLPAATFSLQWTCYCKGSETGRPCTLKAVCCEGIRPLWKYLLPLQWAPAERRGHEPCHVGTWGRLPADISWTSRLGPWKKIINSWFQHEIHWPLARWWRIKKHKKFTDIPEDEWKRKKWHEKQDLCSLPSLQLLLFVLYSCVWVWDTGEQRAHLKGIFYLKLQLPHCWIFMPLDWFHAFVIKIPFYFLFFEDSTCCIKMP